MMSMTQRPRGYVLAIVLGGMLLATCMIGLRFLED